MAGHSRDLSNPLQNLQKMDYPYIIDEKEKDKDIMLIDAVKSHPYIYDHNHQNFKNEPKKEVAWQAIAWTIDMPVEACLRRWGTLRRKFCVEKREQESYDENDCERKPNFTYYEHMLFLTNHIRKRSSAEPTSTAKRKKIGNEAIGGNHTLISSSTKSELVEVTNYKMVKSRNNVSPTPVASSTCSSTSTRITRLVARTQSATIASSIDCSAPPKYAKVVQKIAEPSVKTTENLSISHQESNGSARSTMTGVSCRDTTPSPCLSSSQAETPSSKRSSRREKNAALLQSTLVLLCRLSNLLYKNPRAFEVKDGNEDYFGKLVATELQRIPLEERRRRKLAILQILFEAYNP